MPRNSVGQDERGRLRRRSLLKQVGATGIAGVAGCLSFNNSVTADGVAEKLIKDGFEASGIEPPFSTTIAITQDKERERLAQLFRNELNGTGLFDVSIEQREFGSHVDLMVAAAENRKNAMFVASWTGGWDPDDYVATLFHSDNHTPNGLNVNHYTNDTVDETIEAGVTETDPDERVDIYRRLQEKLVADSPVSFVRFRESIHVWNDDVVSDWRTYPLRPGVYSGVYAPWAGVYSDLEGTTEFVGDLGNDIQNTDPVLMNDTASSKATVLIYDQLLGIDFDGTVQPILADDWTQLDATTYRFSLRDGVRFHNGERLTADHVKGSIERYEGTPREADIADWYDSCEIIDDTTIEISCWREYGPFETAVANILIVPMAAIDGDHDLESEPIGTGPYRFADYESDSYWQLKRFDDHWFDGNEAVPATAPIETVTLRIISEKASRQAALEAGNIHLSNGLPSASISDFEEDDAYGLDRRISGGFDMVIYPLYLAPFSERSVRRGCNMLLPREKIIEMIYHGNGKMAYTPVSPLLDEYSDEAFQESIADEYVHQN